MSMHSDQINPDSNENQDPNNLIDQFLVPKALQFLRILRADLWRL